MHPDDGGGGGGGHLLPSEAYRGVPDVNTLVKGAAGQVLPVGAEGHAVHGFLVLGQGVNANAPLHVPQPHRRVKGGAGRGSQVVRSLTKCREKTETAIVEMLKKKTKPQKTGIVRREQNGFRADMMGSQSEL